MPPAATAARAAVLSDASGKVLAKLKKGDALFVLGESDERVIARTTKGQLVEGLLDRSALTFD